MRDVFRGSVAQFTRPKTGCIRFLPMTTQQKLHPVVGSQSFVETIRIKRKGSNLGELRMIKLGMDEVVFAIASLMSS